MTDAELPVSYTHLDVYKRQAHPDPRYQAFAVANAKSIVASDQGPSCQFGALWKGPFDSADATRQTSALDALIAAAVMQ